MAGQDILHTADIIKAALPFVDARNKVTAEFFVKIFDLMGSLQSFKNNRNTAAHGFETGKIDLEGLLNGIRPVCSIKERGMIDQFLNFFKMKRMFEMYNNMMEMMKNMPDFEGSPFGDSGDSADNVAGNFSGMNFESIFNSMKGNSSEEAQPDTEESTIFGHKADTEASSDTDKDKAPQFGTGMNDKMFDMLKTMVPPEQMSTFENLSMLLKTMSYDNNSKPDDSKESNDG